MAYCGHELEVGLVQQYDILQPNGKFKGKSYSEWAEEWWMKLLSADPDGYRKDDDVVFLRGKYDYVDKGKMREPQTKPNVNKRLGNNGLIICEGTSLFFLLSRLNLMRVMLILIMKTRLYKTRTIVRRVQKRI